MSTLRSKRKMIIDQVKCHTEFLRVNSEKLDIYEGNLLPYIDQILRKSLSQQYYQAIKDRILPVNILQRYVDKVATTYSTAPKRVANNAAAKEFLDYYVKQFDMNTSGAIADAYATMMKGFAWEPYVDEEGEPRLRELPFDKFLVISDSAISPEDETIFVKIMGNSEDQNGECLLFAYTSTEFDAFYMNEMPAMQYLKDNLGVNEIGTIPFVYAKRQKNKLIPTQDTDILSFSKAIPVMLSDAAGAQMFQCFTILYGIDLNFESLRLSPNAFWSLKSDKETDKQPVVGSIKPEADTDKVVSFIMNAFVLWLETKGIRVGSIGEMNAGNLASGISKIVDEMDVHKLVIKSMDWFERDEKTLFNKKLPKIHKYWIESGLVDPSKVPAIIDDPQIETTFERPKPMVSRTEEIANVKDELSIDTILFEDAVRKLHPEYDEAKIKTIVDAKTAKHVAEQKQIQGNFNGADKGNNSATTQTQASAT
jgi:hypothetical protein